MQDDTFFSPGILIIAQWAQEQMNHGSRDRDCMFAQPHGLLIIGLTWLWPLLTCVLSAVEDNTECLNQVGYIEPLPRGMHRHLFPYWNRLL